MLLIQIGGETVRLACRLAGVRALGAVPGTAQRAGAATAGAKLGLRTFPAVPTAEKIIVTAAGYK